jgi:diguanylate cyclase (GGDEF)-like protein
MQVKFAYKNGRMIDTDQMEIEGIFPFFEPQAGGTDFLFLPMHFRNRTVGYLVIENAVYLMEKQYLFQVVKTLTNAMENLHKKEKLEYMNQILSGLYIKDSMTGLYNRMGYQKLSESYFSIMREKKIPVLVLFVDLDRLKYINDTFGHEYGDFAIVSIAKAMQKHCDADAITARTGGDEFIVLESAKDEEAGMLLADKIRAELSALREKMQLPFDLSASIGVVVAQPGEENALESYVKRAEMLMYEEKTEKKVSRDS